jgi:hypothetical protein
MIDKYGRNIKKTTKGKFDIYKFSGLTLTFPKDTEETKVINSFNGMAPEGYKPAENVEDKITKKELKAQLAELQKRVDELE